MTKASKCPHIPSCELFPRFKLQSALAFWKDNYCHGDFERCARYQRSIAGETVPATLLDAVEAGVPAGHDENDGRGGHFAVFQDQ